MKKYIGLVFFAALASCTNTLSDNYSYVVTSGSDDTTYLQDVEGCPRVHIRNNDVKVIQNAEYKDIFEIKAIGYEGYCYYNQTVAKDKAVVKPKFKISRLAESDITDVQFSYYLETVEGPEKYLGRKTYFAAVDIPEGTESVTLTADAGELSIPRPGTYNLDIYLGLSAKRVDYEHK